MQLIIQINKPQIMKLTTESKKLFLFLFIILIIIVIVSFYISKEYTPIFSIIMFITGYLVSFKNVVKLFSKKPKFNITITDNQYCEIESEIFGISINKIDQEVWTTFNGKEKKEYVEEFINLYLLKYRKSN